MVSLSLSYHNLQEANNKGAHQTAGKCRLACLLKRLCWSQASKTGFVDVFTQLLPEHAWKYYLPKIIFRLKGTATLMISMFHQKELYKPWPLIQIWPILVEKWASYGHLKNSIWPTFSRHFEYLISFQNFFNCLIFSYLNYHSICVSADM